MRHPSCKRQAKGERVVITAPVHTKIWLTRQSGIAALRGRRRSLGVQLMPTSTFGLVCGAIGTQKTKSRRMKTQQQTTTTIRHQKDRKRSEKLAYLTSNQCVCDSLSVCSERETRARAAAATAKNIKQWRRFGLAIAVLSCVDRQHQPGFLLICPHVKGEPVTCSS